MNLERMYGNFENTGFLSKNLCSGMPLAPGGSVVKNLPAKKETGSIPRSGRIPGEGHGNPLQYS